MIRSLFILSLLCVMPLSISAQRYQTLEQRDSARQAEYRQKIALDLSVPDFDTKKIDPKVMDPRLANILSYLLVNYPQGTYNHQLAIILSEQNEALENVYFQIKKSSSWELLRKAPISPSPLELGLIRTLSTSNRQI